MKVMLDPSAPDHPKVWLLAEILKIDETLAWGHVSKLWCAAMLSAEDGVFSSWPIASIARKAGWKGKPEVFVRALKRARLITRKGRGPWQLHEWTEHQGDIIERRKRDRERKRKIRAESERTGEAVHEDSTPPILSVPSPALPCPSKPSQAVKSGSVATEIASKYCQMNRGIIGQEKAVNQIQFRLNAGMNAEAALSRVMDPQYSGQKIWDVLDPITPNEKPKKRTVREMLKSVEETDRKAVEEGNRNEAT